MANNDHTSLESILSNLAARQAKETAAAVQAFLGRLIGSAGATPAAAMPPEKRKPGRPPKAAASQGNAAPAAASPKAKAAKAGSRGSPTFSSDDVARVLSLITAKPGRAPRAYRKESKLSEKVFKNLLKALKSSGKVKVVGVGRHTTYTAG